MELGISVVTVAPHATPVEVTPHVAPVVPHTVVATSSHTSHSSSSNGMNSKDLCELGIFSALMITLVVAFAWCMHKAFD